MSTVSVTKPLKLPSREILEKLLKYHPSIGKLFWRERDIGLFNAGPNDSVWRICNAWNSKHAGSEAGYVSSEGYRCVTIFGYTYKAHRIIWKMMHGEEPLHIDHINGDRQDNNFINLRSVSQAENNKNASIRSTNTSGVTGVSWVKSSEKWRVQIRNSGVDVTIGTYANFDEAVIARKAAEKALGYHDNHGIER
jgi:hypothetical protein